MIEVFIIGDVNLFSYASFFLEFLFSFFANVRISQSANRKIDYPKMPLKKSNMLKDFEAIAKSCTVKAYICFCLDDVDSFVDELDHYLVVKLTVLKSS